MSYILDALRKSEQQRQRDAAPLLSTTQISYTVDKQPALLLYGLVAAILVCAGVVIGWLRPWQQNETAPVKDTTALAQNEAKPLQATPVPQPLPQPVAPEPDITKKPEQVIPVQKPIQAKKLASAPINPAAAQRKPQTSTAPPKVPERKVDEAAMPTVEKTIPPLDEADSVKDTAEAAQEQKIVAITELPQAIQKEIPAMSISGYAYSNIPKERSVGINDRLLQEGEYLAPGLRLEQITADGLIFSYKKYLFRHSL
jgi:general secretion pathway protein B